MLFCKQYKKVIIYESQNLARLTKFPLLPLEKWVTLSSYYRQVQLSADGRFIIWGDDKTKYVYANKGKHVSYLHEWYCDKKKSIHISNNEFIWIKEHDNESKSVVEAYDLLTLQSRVLWEFDFLVNNVYYNNELTGWTYSFSNELRFKYFDRLSKDDVILVNYLDTIYSWKFKGNKMALVYKSFNKNKWIALFVDDILKWELPIPDIDTYKCDLVISSGDSEWIKLLKKNYHSVRVYVFKENYTSSWCIKQIRNIMFQYPNIAYGWGDRELWVHDLNNCIRIFRFDQAITAFENNKSIYVNSEDDFGVELLFDYHKYYKLAKFTYKEKK